jgi:hypothetical protein
MSALDLPVVGGDNDTWGTKVNIALTQLQTEGDAALNAEIARATEAEASGFNPTADVAFNGHKATGLANGTTAGDAATFGQIPAALHANDTDLATSGHPATALTVDGTGLTYVATGSVQQGMEDLDGGIQSHTHAAISLHADLTDLTTSGHPASAITNTLTGMTSITHTDVQNALHDLDVAITGAGGGSSLLFTRWKAGGYYGPTMFGSTFASNAISNNTIRAVPFVVATSHTFTALGLETVAVGAGASILRLGVYNDAGDGSPGRCGSPLEPSTPPTPAAPASKRRPPGSRGHSQPGSTGWSPNAKPARPAPSAASPRTVRSSPRPPTPATPKRAATWRPPPPDRWATRSPPPGSPSPRTPPT